MDMNVDIPTWLSVVAWSYIAAALVSTAVMAVRTGHDRSLAPARRFLWLVATVYMGPLALLLHRRTRGLHHRAPEPVADRDSPVPAGLFHTLPGGAASAVAHVIGVPLVVLGGLQLFGLELWAMIATIAVIAVALIVFWETVVTAAGRPALLPAIGAAVLTVLAFDLGMGGWMLFLHFGWIMPPASDVTFVFLMQMGLLLGSLTALPVASRLAAGKTADSAYAAA